MLQRTSEAAAAELRVPVLQGEARVSAEPSVIFGTVLGSCVASCLFDHEAGVG